MKVIYTQTSLDIEGKSVFLAGPTPRNDSVKSWRPEAIKMFKDFGFDGTLLIPEFKDRKDWKENFAYNAQIDWEHNAMELADIILFWIPRKLPDMPAFTTNTEYGYWLAKDPSRITLGIPDNAVKCDYIKYTAGKHKILNFRILRSLVVHTINRL